MNVKPILKLLPLLKPELRRLSLAVLAIFLTSSIQLGAPLAFGFIVDKFISTGQYQNVLAWTGILFAGYLLNLGTSYSQMMLMGTVGQRMLFRLRNMIFDKLQGLPIAFFNRQKTGDLISRINNDTDKLNQFFAETLVRFVGSIVMIGGASVFAIVLNWRLGLAALVPALSLFIFTQLTSTWVKGKNKTSLQALGALSAEVQESLEHFRVIVAFDRRDYFRKRFNEANDNNYKAAVAAGMANGIYTPTYDLAANAANLIVLTYGIALIASGHASIGLLLSFFLYVNSIYGPLRQIAYLWTSFQQALAGWDRVSEILEETAALKTVESKDAGHASNVLEFRGVGFGYPERPDVLKDFDFKLERGKTYALVGPTGGGKTTTASLMARLYDPSSGEILLDGRDLRSYSDEERTQKIGFILQEPFLFTGTVKENIFYGSSEQALPAIFDPLLARFDKGLDTAVSDGGTTLSLGQRQLIAFMRAVLRKPELLILDEATANIDTITEQQLEQALAELPSDTTRVIIAHRLNTIENADGIFFINAGSIKSAGSLKQAMDMLMHGRRQS